MVTPVSLALVFNVVCLTKSVYTIYQLRKVGRHSVVSFVILDLNWWIESAV